ncbi:hypothetical protein F5884DRAFT_843907 [Xylogone sp. PMI_703]|nr:hypothetical protein F5884DRAFT_843907 [Xylogone sp. PMI_703]
MKMPETMRVIDIKGGIGTADDLYFTDFPKPVPAFGINQTDIMQREGQYPVPPQGGRIMGVEFSGIIEGFGDEYDHSFNLGDEVFGLAYGGSYAQYICVSTHMLIHKPENISWVECAGIPETWMTAVKVMYPLGSFAPGKTILWHAGTSGVSISGIQLAIANGASAVYATARSQAKCDFCVNNLGATAAFNTNDPNWTDQILEVTRGKGVDIIVDLIGPSVFSGNIKIGATDARIVLIGLMSGFMVTDDVDLRLLAFKRLRYEGSTLRSRDEPYQRKLRDELVKHGLPQFKEGKFKVFIGKVFPWGEISDTHKLIESNKIMGKIICPID